MASITVFGGLVGGQWGESNIFMCIYEFINYLYLYNLFVFVFIFSFVIVLVH